MDSNSRSHLRARVSFAANGTEIAGVQRARHGIAGSTWYDKSNFWVRGEFERDGSKVQYQLDA